MSATAFYIPSKTSADVSVLEQQISTLKADIAPMKADLASATPSSTGVGGTLVRRDANKDFEASKIKLWHVEAAGPVLNIGNDNQTQTLNIGNGSTVQTLNVGNNGVGSTVINLGGGSDQVKVNLPLKDSTGKNILNVTNNASVMVGPNIVPSNGSTGNTLVGTDILVAGALEASWNTVMGSGAMQAATTGARNTGQGFKALSLLTTGENHVAVGMRAGSTLITGNGCTLLGGDARTAGGATINSTALGFNAVVDGDNVIQLGNGSVTTVRTHGTLIAAGLESIGTTLNIASQNNTNTVNIGSGTAVQTINVGSGGAGVTVINLGGAGDIVNISGTLNNITTTNTQVADKTLVLNSGGTAATAGLAGLYFEEAGNSSNAYVRVAADRVNMELKAPAGSIISLNQSLATTDAVTFAAVSSSAVPTAAAHLANKAYVDSKAVAPSDQSLNTTNAVTFASVTLPKSVGSTSASATLSCYEESFLMTKFSGPGGARNAFNSNFEMSRVGRTITVTLLQPFDVEALSGDPAGWGKFFVATHMLPIAFRPNASHPVIAPVIITNNATRGVKSQGYVQIDGDGKISIYTLANAAGEFIANGWTGCMQFTVTYVRVSY